MASLCKPLDIQLGWLGVEGRVSYDLSLGWPSSGQSAAS
jgi:hypothetical protein